MYTMVSWYRRVVIDNVIVESNMFTAHMDKVSDVNIELIEKAMGLKVKSTPPKTFLSRPCGENQLPG